MPTRTWPAASAAGAKSSRARSSGSPSFRQRTALGIVEFSPRSPAGSTGHAAPARRSARQSPPPASSLVSMTPRKTWLEVALNGGWTRRLQRLIPVTPAEIVAEGIAAVRAGAAIVHVHAYDVASGRQH